MSAPCPREAMAKRVEELHQLRGRQRHLLIRGIWQLGRRQLRGRQLRGFDNSDDADFAAVIYVAFILKKKRFLVCF